MKKNKLTDNLFLRIMAVIVAVLVWIIVVNVSDPIIDSTYSGVPVEILNADLITSQNQTYEVLEGSNNISVTITAKRSINDLLGKENIKATADMQELDEENGTIRIRLETNKYNDKIESIKTKTDVVEVNIEELMKKQFSITPVINGDPVEGYVKGDVTLDQNVVRVQGPESVISKIDHATAEASIAGMSGSISTTSIIRYYDKNDNLLDAARLTGNISSVSIKVELLATKKLPLKFSSVGTPAEDYGVAGEITSDTKEVLVAGKASVLANLSSLNIPASAIDVEGRSEDFTVALDLNKYLPDSIKLASDESDGRIMVKVAIQKLVTRTVKVPRANITITDLSEDEQSVNINGQDTAIELEIKGLAEDLDAIKADEIAGTIDITGYMERRGIRSLKPGLYEFPVQFELPEGIVTVDDSVTLECRVKEIK